MLETIKIIGPIILSWPVVSLLIVLIFRRKLLSFLDQFSKVPGSRAEIGPLKIELGKLAEEGKDAVRRLNRITELMAESRLLELEITSQMFGTIFSEDQRKEMRTQIEELRLLTSRRRYEETKKSTDSTPLVAPEHRH